MFDLKSFINEIIQSEANRVAVNQQDIIIKQAETRKQEWEIYKNIIKSNANFGTFAHFSDLENRFGINPKSNFSTPFGIYGYPIDLMTEELMNVKKFHTEQIENSFTFIKQKILINY